LRKRLLVVKMYKNNQLAEIFIHANITLSRVRSGVKKLFVVKISNHKNYALVFPLLWRLPWLHIFATDTTRSREGRGRKVGGSQNTSSHVYCTVSLMYILANGSNWSPPYTRHTKIKTHEQ
jgi:hypothetical protein